MTSIEDVAARLVWWKPAAEALEDRQRFLAQVMTYGTVEDVVAARDRFGEDAFRQVLADPPAGVFDARSWAYWHVVFGMDPPPELPRRGFGQAAE